ncbi:MAG: hypothetical protein AAB834_02690, partial [Patescibacteria group bacterium]
DRALMLVPEEGEGDVRFAIPYRNRNEPYPGTPIPARRQLLVTADIRRDHLVFSTPGFGSQELNTTDQQKAGRTYQVFVQGVGMRAFDQGDDAAKYFSRIHERPVRLVWMDREQPGLLPTHFQSDRSLNVAAGVDSIQFTLGVLADLYAMQKHNNRPRDPALMRRLRINIEIGGQAVAAAMRERWPNAHPCQLTEDVMDRVRIGELGGKIIESCEHRCDYLNLNVLTGENDGLTAKTLRGRNATSGTGQNGRLFNSRFSPNAIPSDKQISVGIGDPVEVVSWRDEPRVTFRS